MTKARWNTFAVGCCLLAGAIAARVLYLREFSTSPLFWTPVGPDVGEYVEWARNILQGRLLWDEPQIHAPLYPYFLSACLWLTGSNLAIARTIQTGLVLLAAIPLLLALRTAGGGRRSAWLLAVLWAWYPPIVFHSGELVCEALIVPILACSILFLCKADATWGRLRALHLCAAGLLTGLACATHPSALFFAAAEAAVITVFGGPAPVEPRGSLRQRAAAAALLLAATAIPVLPIAAYNTIALKDFVPIQANSGLNFFIGNNKDANGTCYLRPGPAWDAAAAEARKTAGAKTTSVDRHLCMLTASQIAENPLRWAFLLVRKTLYAWNFRELTAGADPWPVRYHTAYQRLFKWAFALCGTLALCGLFWSAIDKRFRTVNRHFIIVAAAFWLSQVVFTVSGRYRIPMLVGALPLAAATLDLLIFKALELIAKLPWRRGRLFADGRRFPEAEAMPGCIVDASGKMAGAARACRPEGCGGKATPPSAKRLAPLVACMAAALAVVLLPTPPIDWQGEKGEAASLLGEALLKAKKPGEALPHLLTAVKESPAWSRHHNLLGTAARELGDMAGAARCFEKALSLDPDDATTLANAALAARAFGDTRKADAYFQEAMRLKDGINKEQRSLLHYNYALHLLSTGKIDDAASNLRQSLELDPLNARATKNLGVVMMSKGKTSEAVELFKRTVRLEPHDARAWLNLAVALASDGRRDAADEAAARAISIDPSLASSPAYDAYKRKNNN